MEENKDIRTKKRRKRKKPLAERLRENITKVLQSKYFYLLIIIAIAWYVGNWIIDYTMNAE